MRKSERLEKQQEVNVYNFALPRIQIKAVSWNKDSHGLFDYESKNYINQRIKKQAGDLLLYRNKETSQIMAHDTKTYKEEDLEDFNFLIRIFSQKQNEGVAYFVGNCEGSVKKKISEQMLTEGSLSNEVGKDDAYLIVKSMKNADGEDRGHTLGIGQCIKLGRVEYSVIEMKTNQIKEVHESSNFSFFKNQSKYEDDDEKIEEGSTCKICMEEADQTNFLFSPCKCSGSCKYIHIGCLKNWMLSKIRKEIIGGTAYYHFDKFQCEICRFPLPKVVVKNKISYELLSVERPQGSYLILEEIGQNKKDLIVIKNIPQTGISLGRGHQCEIRINDISVSRQHAQIIVRDGKFVILDKGSKFGTLIKLTSSIPIDGTKRSLQIGRTVLTFSMKRDKLNTLSREDSSMTMITQENPRQRQKSK